MKNEDKAKDLMIRINQKSAKYQKKDSVRVDHLRKRENQQIKKRNQVVQDMLVQRIITTNERKLEKTLAKESFYKSIDQILSENTTEKLSNL